MEEIQVRADVSGQRDAVCLSFLHHVLFMREMVSAPLHSILVDDGEERESSDRRDRRRAKFALQLSDLVHDLGLFEPLIEGMRRCLDRRVYNEHCAEMHVLLGATVSSPKETYSLIFQGSGIVTPHCGDDHGTLRR